MASSVGHTKTALDVVVGLLETLSTQSSEDSNAEYAVQHSYSTVRRKGLIK